MARVEKNEKSVAAKKTKEHQKTIEAGRSFVEMAPENALKLFANKFTEKFKKIFVFKIYLPFIFFPFQILFRKISQLPFDDKKHRRDKTVKCRRKYFFCIS